MRQAGARRPCSTQVEVEDATGEVCTTVTSNAESATAMHIHKGAAGINGLSVDDRESCSG